MDGFDRLPGALTLGVNHAYTAMYQRDIPNYWAYARHFTLDDHFFSTILGPCAGYKSIRRPPMDMVNLVVGA